MILPPQVKIGNGSTSIGELSFIKAGSDITITPSLTSGTKIGTITVDGAATDLYCETNTDTTYSFTTGSANGTIAVNGSDVAVKGLGSAAYLASSSFLGASATAIAANKLATARAFTIGNTSKNFDGTANLSWNYYEIFPTRSIQADQMANFNLDNYCDLNSNNADIWGWSVTADEAGAQLSPNSIARDVYISNWHTCYDGDCFEIKGQISSSVKAIISSTGEGEQVYTDHAIGLYLHDDFNQNIGEILYSKRCYASAEAEWTDIYAIVKVPADINARKFKVFLQTEALYDFTGQIKIRNIEVHKLGSGIGTIGASNLPIFLNDGVLTACSNTLNVNITGSSASCTGNSATATALTTSAGSSTVPIYFSNGKPVQCSTTLGVNITGNAATATYATNAGTVDNWRITSVDTDANTILTAGCYRCNYNMTNIPASTYGQLLVIHGGGDTVAQIYFTHAGPNMYIRASNTVNNSAGTWTSWKRVWIADDAVTGAVWN